MATVEGAAKGDKTGQVVEILPIRPYRIKRVLDLFAALTLLVLAAPFAGVLAILIRLSSPGPALFKQRRVGKDGKQFVLYKFRSMFVGNDDSRHRNYIKLFIEGRDEELKKLQGEKKLYKMTADDRVTLVGKFLRRTSMDELPQLVNVLRGEMSMVGPRPPLPSEVQKYERWQRRRLSMRPGLTCLWQVSDRNLATFDKWMEYDLRYIDHWSLRLDQKIALQTIPAVLKGTGV